jgi:MFS family permease
MASYSLMQFVFAPMWGAWSDRVGRRPVLLVSTAGAAVSYGIFAYGSTLTGGVALGMILASRVFAGVCGANITVAQAYIADITPPEDRSKRMGLIGMAFGLGFIVGPALAVGAQTAMEKLGGSPHAVAAAPGCIAALLCAANFLFAFARLPESWQPGAASAAKPAPRAHFAATLSRPVIGLLVVTFFLSTFGFTCFESTLGLLIQHNFGLGDHDSAKTNAILFCYAGLIGAIVQAGPIGRLVKKLGEPHLISSSLLIFGAAMIPLPFIAGRVPLSWGIFSDPAGFPWILLLVTVAGLAIGSGLTRPPLFGLLSRLTPADEQGATLGVAQSAGSLARVFGPPFAGYLFDRHVAWPFVICGILALVTGIVSWIRLAGIASTLRTPGAAA